MTEELHYHATDQEIILEKARNYAAQYSLSKGRVDEAERIRRGKADDTPIVEVFVWLFTDEDGTLANINLASNRLATSLI